MLAPYIKKSSAWFGNGLSRSDKGIAVPLSPLCFSGLHTWQAIMETAALWTCCNNRFMKLLNLKHSFLLSFPAKCAHETSYFQIWMSQHSQQESSVCPLKEPPLCLGSLFSSCIHLASAIFLLLWPSGRMESWLLCLCSGRQVGENSNTVEWEPLHRNSRSRREN